MIRSLSRPVTNELAVPHEAEVAGAQAALAALARDRGRGRPRRSPRGAPSSPRRRSGPQPRSRRPGPAAGARRSPGRRPRPPGRQIPGHSRPAAARRGRVWRRGPPRPAPAPPGRRHRRSRRRRAPADDQRRLGEPVAGQERLAAEAARGERRREPLERVRAHRLGAVEGDPPASSGRAAPRCSGGDLAARTGRTRSSGRRWWCRGSREIASQPAHRLAAGSPTGDISTDGQPAR